jgi:hypothetical protein
MDMNWMETFDRIDIWPISVTLTLDVARDLVIKGDT